VSGAHLQVRKRVAVVGVGGLGAPVATGLAEAGFDLVLVDDDRVELSNLQRQVLFGTPDIGRDKLEVALERLRGAFPGLGLTARRGRLTQANADALLADVDLVVDATDDPEARFVVNAWTLARGRPAVLGGVHRFSGLVFAHAGHGPCFQCLFEPTGPETETCAVGGVIGALAGWVGHLQAERATALLRGDARAAGFVTTIDGIRGRMRHVTVPRAADCEICGEGAPWR
jgi:adenylyltransferase/sulfurtransferase